MPQIFIRKVAPAEVEQLQTIGRQTFSETFSENNTAANLKKYLTEGFSTEKLASELQNPDSAFYFALSGGEIIGYLKLNTGPAQTDLKDSTAVEIERIYVLKAFHGKKVGQLLYETALAFAKEMGAAYVWLGVWEENPRAIRFYQKNGFVAFDKHIFMLGNDAQTDIMMKLALNEDPFVPVL